MNPRPVLTVGLIGSGSLAWNLAGNLIKHHFSPEQIIGRNETTVRALKEEFKIPVSDKNLSAIFPDLDIIFICTPDGEIKNIAGVLSSHLGKNTLVIHCSGATPMDHLNACGENTGVIWPMQTLTRGLVSDFSVVPMFIEGSKKSIERVRDIAKTLSSTVTQLDSAQRMKMHLAAVFAINYPTFLLSIAEEISSGLTGTGTKIFEPSLMEMLRKASVSGAFSALTGPAKRGDEKSLQRHRQILESEGKKEWLEIYNLLADMIGNKAKH